MSQQHPILSTLLKIAHAIDQFNQWLGKLVTWLVLVMVAIGVWNVIGRYFGRWVGTNLTSNSLLELQWYLFAFVFFLGTAYTLKLNDHVRVDLFYKNWGEKGKALINFLGAILFLIPFCSLVIYYSWSYVLNSWKGWESSGNEGGLPVYPIKTMILVGWFLLLLQGISEAIKNWAIFTEKPSSTPELKEGEES